MKHQEETSYQRKRMSYIEGNTVRKLETVPQQRSSQTHRELERKRERDRVQEERQQKARAAARKNQQKALQMSPVMCCFWQQPWQLWWESAVSICSCSQILQQE